MTSLKKAAQNFNPDFYLFLTIIKLSFTYQYKLEDSEWSVEQVNDQESSRLICQNFAWPKDSLLKNAEWDSCKSALLFKIKGSLEELEFAALDTEAIVICYTPNGLAGFQRHISTVEHQLNEHFIDHIKLFFNDSLEETVILNKYNEVNYSRYSNATKLVIIAPKIRPESLDIHHYILGLSPVIMFLFITFKLDWSFLITLLTRITLATLYIPKVILVVFHYYNSLEYKYVYSVSENTLFQFKGYKLLKELSLITEVHFISEFFLFPGPSYNQTELGYTKFITKNEEIKISSLQMSFSTIYDLRINTKTKSYQRSYPWVN